MGTDKTKPIYLPPTEEIGGRAASTITLTPASDCQPVSVPVPPGRVIPIVFIPGVMGSHLRISRTRQKEFKRRDNRAWRPDDKWNTLSRGSATPAERQMTFDPAHTEVDRYEITEDAGRFDMTGELTRNSDKRHDSVPDDLPDIGLLMSAPLPPAAQEWCRPRNKQRSTAAQKARWRGWSEVLFESYGDVLKLMEARMNNMVGIDGKLSSEWANPKKIRVLGVDPGTWGATTQGAPLTERDIRRVANCWYPVYALGYNWLESNGDSARKLAGRIDEIIRTYQRHGRRCQHVIVVTHSMGGIVARAMMHPAYGQGIGEKILGVYHSVQPTVGAAAAYKRVRAGMGSGKASFVADIANSVIGKTGPHVTAVFANAPGPLELLPTPRYPDRWLRLETSDGKLAMALPMASPETLKSYRAELSLHTSLGTAKPPAPATVGEPHHDIYGQAHESWWRLLNPAWINPAILPSAQMDPQLAAKARVGKAQQFHQRIQDLFHPNTYASYGADASRESYGSVTWRVNALELSTLGSPLSWKLDHETGDGLVFVRANARKRLRLSLQPEREAGDETVPAEASGGKVRGKMVFRQTGYEHQASYQDDGVLASLLYSLVRIAGSANWWEQ